MSDLSLLSPPELSLLRDVVSLGLENAARGLSAMVDKEIKVTSPFLDVVPIEQVPKLVARLDEEVVTVYLGVSGDATGHILLMFSLEAADELVRMLMGSRAEGAETLNSMERSALGEVANVTGSTFLCALADATNLVIQPSPPAVMIDMAGAALDVPLISLAASMEEVLTIDTWFIDEGRRIKSLFLMFPTSEALRLIVERLEKIRG